MGRPRKIDAQDTKARLLDAALELFSTQGFFGTSMRQIARRVGVRESALYHYFPSKNAILEHLLASLGPGRVALIDAIDVQAMVKALGVYELLESMVRMMIAAWASPEERMIAKIVLTEGARLANEGGPAPQQLFQQSRSRVAKVFQTLIDDGYLIRAEADSVALAFLGPLMALRITHLVVAADPPDVEGLFREAERHLKHFWKTHKK